MLPTYLELGMTPDEFWHGDAQLVVAYREADRLRRVKQAHDEWKQGLYTMLAIAASMSKDAQYPEEPLFLPPSKTDAEDREKRKMENDLMKMEAFAISFNKKFKGE